MYIPHILCDIIVTRIWRASLRSIAGVWNAIYLIEAVKFYLYVLMKTINQICILRTRIV